MKGNDTGIKERLSRIIIRWAAEFFARELCKGILGREPGKRDLAKCAAFIRECDSLAPLAQSLVLSKEFQLKHFDVAAPSLVNSVWKGVLGREPDEVTHKAFTAQLVGDHDLAGFIFRLIESLEFEIKYKERHRLSAIPSLSARSAIPGAATRGRLIVVSSNCQTAGMAAALQACLPDDTIVPMPMPVFNDQAAEGRFLADMPDADVWVAMTGWRHLLLKNTAGKEKKGFQFVEMPAIVFPAFHPDLCYVRKVSDREIVAPPYNSAIAVWAYNNGLDIADAKRLFNRQSYAGLGYFDYWEPSVAALREPFSVSNLDFDRFMLAIKRLGMFMHTVNHPMVSVMVELAKLVSLKIGAPESILDRAISVNDGLTEEVWPLYPEVAEELALPNGSYDWKMIPGWLEGIESYLEFAYSEYEKQKIPQGGLKLENRDEALYDCVLGPQVGVTR